MLAKVICLCFLMAAGYAQAWQPVAVPTTASLRGLRVVSEQVVWASGTGGTVLRTTDGGNNWSQVNVAGQEKLDFRGIWAWDKDTAWVMSSGKAEDGLARIFVTRDGGRSWLQAFEEKTAGVFFDAIAFWNRSNGIVLSDPVDGRFLLFLTEDGGANWRRVSAPALAGEGAFAASNSCLTVQGEQEVWFATGGAKVARVFHSRDRGRSWSVADTPLHPLNASSGVFSLAFRDSLHGFAVGGDYAHPDGAPLPNAMSTSDGGKTWRAMGENAKFYLSSVAYKPGTRQVLAGGSKGMEAGPPWRHINDLNINAVAYSPHGGGWAVGPHGTILKEYVAIRGQGVGTSGKPN